MDTTKIKVLIYQLIGERKRHLQKHKESTRRPLWFVRILLGCSLFLGPSFITLICFNSSLALPKLTEKERDTLPSPNMLKNRNIICFSDPQLNGTLASNVTKPLHPKNCHVHHIRNTTHAKHYYKKF